MKIKPTLLNNCEVLVQWQLQCHDAVEFTGFRLRFLTRLLVLNTNFSWTYVLQERVIVNFILFTRAKLSCCWFFRILITASAVDFFELPFAKVTFLWLDWRLLPTGCWSEFADRHMPSHLKGPDTLDVQILNSTSRFEALWNLLASNWPGKYKNSSWLINFQCLQIWPCACSYVRYVVDSVHSCQSK